MTRRASLALPVALLGALALTACGDDADKAPDFTSAAVAICEEAGKAFKDLPTPTSPTQLTDYVDKVVSIVTEAQTDLAALELPADRAADLQAKVLAPLAADAAAAKGFADKVKAAAPGEVLGLIAQRPKPTVDTAYLRSVGLGACADALASTAG